MQVKFFCIFSLSACTALFVPFFNEREIIRYKFNYSTPLFVGGAEVSNGFAATFTIMSMKEKIMRSLNGSPDNVKTMFKRRFLKKIKFLLIF